mmetsp:Transcript_8085/g.17482  ORF Transcript_8085/g.17482 Transcript_8085/m.17482 type:complete len:160 (-) Transcript_8085:283-762(-)
MIPSMTKVFADEGLKYSLGGMTGNTLDSHRLSEWARTEYGVGKQDELMTAMFDSYFCNEKYLGDHDVLIEAATRAGLPADAARSVLEDEGRYLQEVETEMEKARRMRVSGVPFFVVHPAEKEGEKGSSSQRPFGVSGAQPSEAFIDILEECGIDRPDDA